MATQWTAGTVAGEILTAATLNTIGAASVTFTPTWTATVSAPAIGNGTLTGRYFQIAKIVFVETLFVAGSTTTFGSGNYLFALPVTARAGLYGFMPTGICRVFDNSAGTNFFTQATFRDSSVTNMQASATGTTLVSATSPMTFANGDEISLVFQYEAA